MTIRPTLCILLLVLGMFGCVSPSLAQQPPSIESIVAALNAQELASGPSLDVTYTWGSLTPPKAGTGRSEIRYVRTPQLLFMEVKQEHYDSSGGWKLFETIRCSFNRSTGKYREVGTSGSGGVPEARVSSGGHLMRFASDPIPDVLFKSLLGTKPLVQAVASGRVAKQQELIDGAMCWRVDMPYKVVGSQESDVTWSVWLDPKIGFCPRQIATNFWSHGTGHNRTTDTFSRYRGIEGVWVPMRQVSGSTEVEVKTVLVGTQIDEAELRVVFPEGSHISAVPGTGCFPDH
jgi:hypothetical protein